MYYAVVVKRPTGYWARRSDAEGDSHTIEDFIAQVKTVTDRLTRYGDVWRIVEIPSDDSLPTVIVYDPKGS